MSSARRARRSRLNGSSRVLCEPLELRRLLCGLHVPTQPIVDLRPDLIGVEPTATESPDAADIVWVNRGTDGFDAVFGANAEVARGVVDAVIFEYEQMITSFNYGNGSTNFDLTLNMGNPGLGGSAQPLTSLGGKPKTGTMTLRSGNNGQGSGYFIDPTPFNLQEFVGTITNAYAGDAQIGSPAAGLVDFYTVVAAEMAHTLGLFTDPIALPGWSARTSNTGITDNSEGGGVVTFWVFDGPSIKHLMTSNNGGPGGQSMPGAVHTAGLANVSFNNITWIGAQDAGNAVMESGRRYLVPDTLGLMFKDAYDYTVVTSGRFNFYTVWNPSNGELLVRGRDVVDNTFAIKRNGANIEVSVDPISDVGGTGALPGGGNFPPFTTVHNPALISDIVVEGSNHDDLVTVDYVNGNPIPGGGVSFDGGAAAVRDMLIVNGSGAADTFTLDSGTVSNGGTVTYVNAEFVTVNGQGGSDTVNVNSLTVPATINGGDNDDSIQVGAGNLDTITFALEVNGDAGADVVAVNDSAQTSSDRYSIDFSTFLHPNFGGLVYGTIEAINVYGATGGNTYDIHRTASFVPVHLFDQGGTDTINVNETAFGGAVFVFPSTGDDSVNINLDNFGGAFVVFGLPQRIGALTIGSGGYAQLFAGIGNILTMTTLTMAGGGKLDLTDGAAIVDYTGGSPVASIQSLVTGGYAGAAWNGDGIMSSTAASIAGTAVGFAEATDLFTTFPATFSGQQVDNTSILIKYTYYGDANLDGTVNLNDFNRLAANFGQTNRRWSHGDFDYSTNVNLNDFNRLASNFGLAGLGPDRLSGLDQDWEDEKELFGGVRID